VWSISRVFLPTVCSKNLTSLEWPGPRLSTLCDENHRRSPQVTRAHGARAGTRPPHPSRGVRAHPCSVWSSRPGRVQGCAMPGMPASRRSAEPPNTGAPPPQARRSRRPTPLQLGAPPKVAQSTVHLGMRAVRFGTPRNAGIPPNPRMPASAAEGPAFPALHTPGHVCAWAMTGTASARASASNQRSRFMAVHLPQCAPGRARSAAGVQRRTSAANARRMPSQRDSMADPQLMRTSVAAHHRARPATAGTRRGSLARRPARARSSTAARSRGHGARPPVLPSANETSRKCRRLLCAC